MTDLQGLALGYVNWLLTVSVALTLLSTGALLLRRYIAASIGFLSLGTGAIAIVWDGWSARAGHHMELTALLDPVALSSRDAFLLVTHLPFIVVGVLLMHSAQQRQRLQFPVPD